MQMGFSCCWSDCCLCFISSIMNSMYNFYFMNYMSSQTHLDDQSIFSNNGWAFTFGWIGTPSYSWILQNVLFEIEMVTQSFWPNLGVLLFLAGFVATICWNWNVLHISVMSSYSIGISFPCKSKVEGEVVGWRLTE